MKVINIKLIQKLDPEDVELSNGEAEREIKRKKIINKFLKWAQKNKPQWATSNNEERIIIKRQFAYFKLLLMFGTFSNFAFYNCFLTGIYNFRTTEVLDMRKIPFVAKFAVSTLITYFMCKKLWNSNIYEAELYSVAIKYRSKFD